MNTATAYTPLESLLLFQSLAVSGTDPNVFIQTSNLLKRNTLIRDGETYDPGRLSPDALRELYLQLLREELRLEVGQVDNKGDVSPSKKRKLQTPALPTIKDAREYSERLPQLVDRLYGRYRDYMIRLIREDEKKYETLQLEIEEIERGEWDERIQREDQSRPVKTKSVTTGELKPDKTRSESPLPVTNVPTKNRPANEEQTPSLQEKVESQDKASPPPTQPSHADPKPEGLAISDVFNSREPPSSMPADPTGSSTEVSSGPQTLPQPGHQRSSSQERLPVSTPLQVVQQRPLENWKWEQYQGGPPGHQPPPPPPFQPNPNHPQYSPQQFPTYPQLPPRGSFPMPSQGLPLPPNQVLSSPVNNIHPNPHSIVLGPPSGRAPSSPATHHLDQLAEVAEQQYRAPSASPLMNQGSVPGSPYGIPYQSHSPQYRGSDGRPLSGNGPPQQWSQQYPPPYPPLPNFNYSPQPPPNQRPFPARPEVIQHEQRQYNSPYIPNQGVRPAIPPSSSTPRPLHLRDNGSLPHTPASYGMARNSTGRATRWTPNPVGSTPRVPGSPIQPTFEPISPILLPTKPAKTPKANGKTRKTDATSTKQPRLKGQRGKLAKIDSPASSAVADSYRSQSVMSHADELSLLNEGIAGRVVKQESATPRAVDDMGETTADESTTRRRGSRRTASPRRTMKRKRQDSPPREPSGPPTQVLWTRNFPKISSSALERVAAHRHASMFAHPIKERGAPGYKQLILRPQDLKSIRTAISSGFKAGIAVASTIGDQGQAGVMQSISEDLIPPRGIVNNAQLEKELMRMFANAIMFNHDPRRGFGKAFEVAASIEESGGAENYDLDEHGVVNDTRAMFADVEKIVMEMRSAERVREKEAVAEVEDDDVDELAGAVDIPIGSVAKRRRRV